MAISATRNIKHFHFFDIRSRIRDDPKDLFFPFLHSVSDSIRSSIRAFEAKEDLFMANPKSSSLSFHCQKSELNSMRDTRVGIFTILCSILSFSHVPSSIIYQGSRRMLRARRNRRGKVMVFTADPASPKQQSLFSFSFSFRINNKFALWGFFYHTRKRRYSVLVLAKVNTMSTGR